MLCPDVRSRIWSAWRRHADGLRRHRPDGPTRRCPRSLPSATGRREDSAAPPDLENSVAMLIVPSRREEETWRFIMSTAI
jgi:hypothetical protein